MTDAVAADALDTIPMTDAVAADALDQSSEIHRNPALLKSSLLYVNKDQMATFSMRLLKVYLKALGFVATGNKDSLVERLFECTRG